MPITVIKEQHKKDGKIPMNLRSERSNAFKPLKMTMDFSPSYSVAQSPLSGANLVLSPVNSPNPVQKKSKALL